MDITRLFLTLFLSLICTTSWATVGVMRFGNGAPVQVCQPSDANTNCGGGTSSVNWTDLGGLQSAVNVSGFTNDPPYIRNADINWTAFPNAQGYITTWTETDPKVGTLITNMAPHWNGTALANGVIYDNGANVGIGSSVPRGALDVNGTIYGSYIWTTNIKSTANNVGIGSSVPHAKLEVLGGIYQSGGTAYFSGNLGIGSSAPATVLDVVGAGTTSTTQSLAIRNSNGTRNVTVLDNGNVGVGSSLPTNL